ncbi:MAG: DUF1192 domain-containing protein [Candidatus Devosia phytovorans]|uniref:DUF1192 domain-containing protein n=1 Tax=Candidatus Devosia phytovorans TaxID=3121372 RepID=A0AAJ6B060_9HYPH|nr:DUF1192 domain-containing protein [Devosia sp.]WEK04867.1 MAG: DUF1192 domain-containing protein [Devosia sp.]
MLDEVDLLCKRMGLDWTADTDEKRLLMFDEEIKKPKGHEVGMIIDTMSVEELAERIGLLEAEILRLKAAIDARGASKKAADAAFEF